MIKCSLIYNGKETEKFAPHKNHMSFSIKTPNTQNEQSISSVVTKALSPDWNELSKDWALVALKLCSVYLKLAEVMCKASILEDCFLLKWLTSDASVNPHFPPPFDFGWMAKSKLGKFLNIGRCIPLTPHYCQDRPSMFNTTINGKSILKSWTYREYLALS